MADIGESLVVAYLRQVQGCHLVTYNQFLPGKQGEIDVIAMTGADDTVWLCEVTTHNAYTDRLRDLYMHAAANPSRTADPAYRMLQIISRLRGGKLSFSD